MGMLPMHLLWNSSTGAVLGRLIILGGALPLQMCEHSVVTFALALQKAGASPGTAFAFLLSAPASNFATISLVLRHAGGASAAIRCGVVVVATAVSLSYISDAAGMDLAVQGEGDDSLPQWYVEGSVWAVGFLSLCSVLRFVVRQFGMEKRSTGTHQESCCSDETCHGDK